MFCLHIVGSFIRQWQINTNQHTHPHARTHTHTQNKTTQTLTPRNTLILLSPVNSISTTSTLSYWRQYFWVTPALNRTILSTLQLFLKLKNIFHMLAPMCKKNLTYLIHVLKTFIRLPFLKPIDHLRLLAHISFFLHLRIICTQNSVITVFNSFPILMNIYGYSAQLLFRYVSSRFISRAVDVQRVWVR